MNRQTPSRTILLPVLGLVAAAGLAAGSASAATTGKPSASGGGTTTATISLSNLSSPGAAPSFGQQVTFSVSTTATSKPFRVR